MSEQLTQEQLKLAMVAALKEFGAVKSSDIANMSRDFERQERERQAQNRRVGNQQGQQGQGQSSGTSGGEFGMGNASAAAQGSASRNVVNTRKLQGQMSGLAGEVKATYDNFITALSSDVDPFVKQFNTLQETYGGMNVDLDQTRGSARAALDTVLDLEAAFHNIGGAGDQMERDLGISSNLLYKHFDTAGEAAKITLDTTNYLINQYSNEVNEIDKATKARIAIQAKATGLEQRRMAELMEQEILRTGHVSGTMVDQIAKYSSGLADSLGLNRKSVQRTAASIIVDTQRMGDITEEEATRMAATLGKLGQTYEGFSKVTSVFEEFGSSAEAASKVAQLTGGQLQLNADLLTQVAVESPDQLPQVLKQMFEESGFTEEKYKSLGMGQQRLIAKSIGFKRDEIIGFLRGDASQAEIQAAADRIAADDTAAFDSVTDQLGVSTKYSKTASEQFEEARVKGLVPLREEALKAGGAFADYNEHLHTSIKTAPEFVSAHKKMFDGMTGTAVNAKGYLDEQFPDGIDPLRFGQEGYNALYQQIVDQTKQYIPGMSSTPVQNLSGPMFGSGNASAEAEQAASSGSQIPGRTVVRIDPESVNEIAAAATENPERFASSLQNALGQAGLTKEVFDQMNADVRAQLASTIGLSEDQIGSLLDSGIAQQKLIDTRLSQATGLITAAVPGADASGVVSTAASLATDTIIQELSTLLKQFSTDSTLTLETANTTFNGIKENVATLNTVMTKLLNQINMINQKESKILIDAKEIGTVLTSKEFEAKNSFSFEIDDKR